MNQAFSKIWIPIVLIIVFAGGIFAWQYFGTPKEKIEGLKEGKEETKLGGETEEKIIEEIKETEKTTEEKLINKTGLSLGRDDLYRATYVKMIGSALFLYYQDHNQYPTALNELLEPMVGKTRPYLGGEESLKDPATKKFYEYRFLSGVNDYELCVNYDVIGRECYNSQDFKF